MVEIIVFAEGVTEERFIKQVLAPALHPLQIYMKPQLLHTSQNAKGGAISLDRLMFNARNTLRQHPHAVLGTFLDLYALDTDFPAFLDSKGRPDVYSRVACLETALRDAVVSKFNCRPDRFLPHIQPHEFEGLLFSDVEALCGIEPKWEPALNRLRHVRASAESPEHINDGYDTKPSKRLETLLHPAYKKTTHGPRAAERITLEVIERECRHFSAWMNSVRALARG